MIKYQVQCIRVYKIVICHTSVGFLEFFIQKFHKHKKHEMLTANKNKKCS